MRKKYYVKRSTRFSFYVTCIMIFMFQAWTSYAAMSFHTGAAGECEECHEGTDGKLKGFDAGSTCLRCHEAPIGGRANYCVATNGADLRGGRPPSQMTPGGDFGYLKKNYRWSLRPGGKEESSPGDGHGHNINAASYNYVADKTHATAPGGSYPAAELSCISCHDPHGKIARGDNASGAYRMLGGIGYSPHSARGIVFTVAAPVAVAPREYNRAEAMTSTRVAYGKGMSEWCTNCHTNWCSGTHGHPTCGNAKCRGNIVANYNGYVKTGAGNGQDNASYTSLVPFEEGIDDKLILAVHASTGGSFTRGPDWNSNVMCLTCHRAHASAWDSITRWNMTATFIVYKGLYPGIDNGAPAELAQGRTSAEMQVAYYGRPCSAFSDYQRSLCNKCHMRD